MLCNKKVDKKAIHGYPLVQQITQQNALEANHGNLGSALHVMLRNKKTDELIIYTLQAEVDEMFSFVGNKANKQCIN